MLLLLVASLYLWMNVKEARGSDHNEHSFNTQNATVWATGLIDKEEYFCLLKIFYLLQKGAESVLPVRRGRRPGGCV